MFRRSFFARLVAVIVFVSVLVGGGFMAFRAGEARGYAVGVTSAQQAQAQPNGQSQVAPLIPAAPGMPYAYPGYFYGYRPHFFPFGLLLFPFGLLFFFIFVGGLMRFMLWGAFGRGHWRHHHHGPWGHPGMGEQPAPAAGQPAKPAE